MNYLLQNLTYLTDYNLKLISEIESICSDEIETLEVGDDVIFKLMDNEGNEFYSSSIYDPVYEAGKLLADVNFDNTGYVLLGLNSSAVLKEILVRKTDTAWVLVVEKDPRIIKKFLETVNLSSYLQEKLQRLVFIYGDRSELEGMFDQFMLSITGYYFLQAEIIRTYPTYRVQQDDYQWSFQLLVDKIRQNMINLGNSLEDSQKGIKNELKNLKHVLHSRPLKHVENRFKNLPIVCVASGPSLDKQLPLLKELQGRALIISAESAFRVLLRNGIVPDALCILERGEASYDLSLKGIDIPDKTVLFGLTLIDPRIYESWPGHIVPVFKENITHCRLLNRALGDYGTMYSGNSVAHMNFNLAFYLGGNPIIFIGQDLAYAEDGKTHSKDTFYDKEELEKLDDHYKKLIQQNLQDPNASFNREVYVDGYYGGKVRTRELWRLFLMWFVHLLQTFRREDSVFINATEGGADIPGTVKMSFREAIDTYCQKPIPSISDILDQQPIEVVDVNEKLQSFCNHIHKTINRIGKLAQLAELNLSYIEDFKRDRLEQKNTDLYQLKLTRILKLTESILQSILTDEFGSFYFSPLVSNYHVKVNPISRINSEERAEAILEHQKFFLERVIRGKEELEPILRDGVTNVIKEFGFTLDNFSIEEEEETLYGLTEDEGAIS